MIKIFLKNMPEQRYNNRGQEAERRFKFTLTGQDLKADNTPSDRGCDILDISIKSARATVCRGQDIIQHLAHDKAQRFAYVTSDFTSAYIMTKKEYIEFVNTFSKPTRESSKNGGQEKLRLSTETNNMRKWLALRA